MINRHGLMRLGAIQRIGELEIELDELRAILKSPAQPTAAAYRTTKRPAERRATSDDRPGRPTPGRTLNTKKPHWMQLPENAGKVRRMMTRLRKARDAKR